MAFLESSYPGWHPGGDLQQREAKQAKNAGSMRSRRRARVGLRILVTRGPCQHGVEVVWLLWVLGCAAPFQLGLWPLAAQSLQITILTTMRTVFDDYCVASRIIVEIVFVQEIYDADPPELFA